MGILDAPGYSQAQADSRFASAELLKLGTKRATMGTGGGGTDSTFTIPIAGGTCRVPFRFGMKVARFRAKIRSFDTISQTAGPVMTGKGITYGLASTSGNDFETFAFAGSSSTPIVSSDFTIPGDGSWYTSPWVTANTPTPLSDWLLGVAFVPASGAAAVVPRGTGRVSWFDSNTTTALNSASSPTAVLGSVPLEYAIEYEFVSDHRVVACIGDSITKGVGGKVSDSDPGASQPEYKSWPAMAGVRQRFTPVNLALSGTEASQWLIPTWDRWTRYDLTTTIPDAAYIGFGSNDVNSSTPLATFQANLRTVVANMRAKIGNDKPIYLGTITPRNFDTTREALRQDYNKWLRTGPFRVAGVLDFDKVLRNEAAPATVITDYFNSDNTHPSRAGYNAMQLSVPQLLAV